MAKAMGGPKKKPMTTTKEPVPEYVCPHCGELKKKTAFYVSSDPAVSIGVAFPCKDCAENIARRYDPKTGDYSDVTEVSLKNALMYLDKPFLKTLWDSAYNEVHDPSLKQPKHNMWTAYIKSVQMVNYKTMRWRDGDLDDVKIEGTFDVQANALDEDSEQYETYQKNKKAVINFVGWDPFRGYPRKDELPLLYAQLLTFLDDETKNDGQKLNAVIQIVKLFNQAEKINKAIDELQTDTQKIIANTSTVKTLREAASKAISDANALAKDNGISVNFNSNKSKGANTLSGKMKELVGMGLREAKINTYDIGTCEGMKQVALINEECRHRQIGYDENIAQEIKDIKVELVEKLTKERDEAVETARKLLLENKDLKDFLLTKKLVDEDYEVIDDE
jgi:hypothetical protein